MHTAKHTMCGNDATSMNSANMKLNTLLQGNLRITGTLGLITELIKLVVNIILLGNSGAELWWCIGSMDYADHKKGVQKYVAELFRVSGHT